MKPDRMTNDFERLMLPHLDAAYRLAVWLMRDDQTAQDVVQDSFLRAFKAWPSFEPGNARAWLLTIVRRQALTRLKGRSYRQVDLDDEAALQSGDVDALSLGPTQEAAMIEHQTADQVRTAIASLPAPLREVIILKDMDDMAYKDIARVLNVPIGTVMSRLSRARDGLRLLLKANAHA